MSRRNHPRSACRNLQFEALLSASRQSPNHNNFALVAMLGLLGMRTFEATGADIGDLGEEHGHRVLRVACKGTRIVLVPLPPAVARAIERAVDDRMSGPILRNTRGARMDRHAATRRLRNLAADWSSDCRACTRICFATPSLPPCSMRALTSATSRSPPVMPTRAPPCGTTGLATTSTVIPTDILAAYMASGT
jgi:integrase